MAKYKVGEGGEAFCTPPSQDEALGAFGSAGEFKNLNREGRGEFAAQGPAGKNPKAEGAVEGSGGQDAALAEWGSLSGGGKLSSIESGDAGPDPLQVLTGSEYNFNADSPFRR